MPKEIGDLLIAHEVVHATQLGWQGLSNGKLLDAGESARFSVLLTKDTKMPYQQNLANRTICLVILRPRSQFPDDLLKLAPQILLLLPTLLPGSVTRVSSQ